MTEWLDRIHVGDCRDLMRAMIGAGVKVNCIVTSPPYFGLRDYGHAEQIGLESSPVEFVEALLEVFRLARDLLADDGTLWLNLGDTYSTSGGPGWQGKNGVRSDRRFAGTRNTVAMREQARTAFMGSKPKDLLGMPWRVAFALQADGWYLRQDIIWHKPNPMPESVRDRCTKSHEYLFLLAKSERYHFDTDAIAEPVTLTTVERMSQPGLDEQHGSDRVPGKTNGPMKAVLKRSGNKERKPASARGVPIDTGGESAGAVAVAGSIPWEGSTRNKRSVWTITTKPFTGAHFATFPRELVEPCILAGCPPGGVVFDPFMGSGTVAEVAMSLGRRYLGCELNPEYAALFETHRSQQVGMAL